MRRAHRAKRAGRAGPLHVYASSRTALRLLLIAAIAGFACAEPQHPPARAVILISCDTLRADHLGFYGYPRDVSANLDAFAANAVVFDRAYATAPHTNPALSSLLTSRLPDEIGVSGDNRSLMPAQVDTLPEILERSGIETAAIVSNWALRRPDPGRGDIGVAQGFAHYNDTMGSHAGLREGHFERLADATSDAAIAQLARMAQGGKRFFLWVHYQDPHGPYTPPAAYRGHYESPPTHGILPRLGATQEGFGQIPHYQILDGIRRPEFYRDRYDEEIRFFDAQAGRLLASIEAHGLYDDSLVVFTADHGESLGEHNYWFTHEANLYDEEVRVPLVVRYPPGFPKPTGREPAGHLDFVPTVLDAFGLPKHPARGTSLIARTLPRDRIFPHSLQQEGSPLRWFGISDAHYRLVIPRSGPQLFDIRDDPGEQRNLAADEPDRVEHMIERYRAFVAALPAPAPVEGVTPELDDDARRALEALGYLPPSKDPAPAAQSRGQAR